MRLPALFFWANRAAEATFSADGQELAVIDAGRRVRRFDTKSLEEKAAIRHVGAAHRISFSPSGKFLAIGAGDKVQLWDLAASKLWRTLPVRDEVFSLAWFPDERRLVTAGFHGGLSTWDLDTGEFHVLNGHASTISTVTVDAQGDLIASTSYDGSSKIWDGATGRFLISSATRLALGFTANGDAVLWQSGAGRFGYWPVARSRSFQNTRLSQRRLYAMSLSADARWLVTSDSDNWRLWDVTARREVAFRHSPKAVTPIFRPNRRELLTLGPETLLRWPLQFDSADGSVQVGEPQTLLIEPGVSFQRASVTPDGRWLAIAGHQQSYVIDLDDPSRVVAFSRGRSQSFAAIRPAGDEVVIGSFFEGVTAWDAHTGKFDQTLATNRNCPVVYSPDGRWLAASAPSECHLWDAAELRLHHRFPSDAASVEGGAIAFSGEELATFTAPQAEKILSLAWSADSSQLVALTSASGVQAWHLDQLRANLTQLGLDWQLSSSTGTNEP